MGLIKLNQYIQSWRIGRCPIKEDGKTLNRNIQEAQSRLVHMGILLES